MDKELYRAFLEARDCADHLLQAHALENYPREFHAAKARYYLTRLADKLGLDVVERTAPARAEAA